MRKGVAQFITEDDLPPLLSSDESAKLGNDLGRALEKQCVVPLRMKSMTEDRLAK